MFYGSITDRIALTEILASPGGEKLSREAAFFCAQLITMPEPVRKRHEKIESFKRTYENPRGLPEAWIDTYLSQDNVQLAIDVIRAFDEKWKSERSNKRLRLIVWVMTLIVSPLIGEVVKLLFALLFK